MELKYKIHYVSPEKHLILDSSSRLLYDVAVSDENLTVQKKEVTQFKIVTGFNLDKDEFFVQSFGDHVFREYSGRRSGLWRPKYSLQMNDTFFYMERRRLRFDMYVNDVLIGLMKPYQLPVTIHILKTDAVHDYEGFLFALPLCQYFNHRLRYKD